MFDKKAYNRAWGKANYQKNKQIILAKQRNSFSVKLTKRESAHLLKTKVLAHYSNPQGTPICNNCGEQDIDTLCIDHISGGGYKQKKHLRRLGGKNFYIWLREEHFPIGLQTLCFNCNIKKTRFEIHRLWSAAPPSGQYQGLRYTR